MKKAGKFYLAAPEIPDNLVFYWNIYHFLHRRSSSTEGYTCVSMQEVKAFCEFHHISGSDTIERLQHFIDEMDSAYLSVIGDKREQAMQEQRAKSQSRGGRR